jgi:hypothetical protein
VIPIELALVWSGDRTIVTLVIGAAAVAPALLMDTERTEA